MSNMHYISQFHLREFVSPTQEDQKLWVYDKETGRSNWRSPRSIMSEEGFYRESVDEELKNLEGALSSPEGFYHKLTHSGNPPKQATDLLSGESMKQVEEHLQLMAEYVRALPARSPKGKKIALEANELANGQEDFEWDYAVNHSKELLSKYRDLEIWRKWTYAFVGDNPPLVIGDWPVIGFVEPHPALWMPLSRSMYLVIENPSEPVDHVSLGGAIFIADSKLVRSLNQAQVQGAVRYVISSVEESWISSYLESITGEEL